jgi:predicted metal-binding protein
MTSESKSAAIEHANVPWSDALILVCTKCSKKIRDQRGPESPDLTESLKNSIKAHLRSANLAKQIRIVTSSCLDVCPENRLTVAVATEKSKPTFKTFTIDPDLSPTEVLKEVMSKI